MCAGGTYIERDLTSSCVPAGATTGNQLASATAATATLSATVSPNTVDAIAFAFTAASANRADWGTGSYTVELNVTAVGSSIPGYQVQLVRTNSSCGDAPPLATSASQSGTGLKTFTFTGVSSVGAATDRLQVRVLASATGGSKGSRTLSIQVNTTNAEVRVPWCSS